MAESTNSASAENHVLISEDFRSMEVPYGENVLGCVGDVNVRTVYFDVPRYCDGTDLSTYSFSVNYLNAAGTEDRYAVLTPTVGTDTITLTWLVGYNACAVKGKTSVSIKAQLLDGDEVVNEFNSTVYKFTVKLANTTSAAPIQEYSDAFTALVLQWSQQVTNTANAAAQVAYTAANTANTAATNADDAADAAHAAALEITDKPNAVFSTTVTATEPQTVDNAWPSAPRESALYGKSAQNGTPTPSNSVTIYSVVAPNLFNIETASIKKYIRLSDGGAADSDDWSASDYIPVEPGETYTLSGISQGWSSAAGMAWYDANKVFISSETTNTNPLTAPANAAFIRLSLSTETPGSVQFEHGTTASHFCTYDRINLAIGGNLVDIDLQGNTLASLPDGTRDVLRVDSAGRVTIEKNTAFVTYSDSMHTGTWGNDSMRYIYTSLVTKPYEYDNYGMCLSDKFANSSSADWSIISGSDGVIAFKFTAATGTITYEQARAALASAAPKVLYALQSPQTIDLGYIELPELSQTCEIAIYASLDPEWSITYENDPNVVANTLEASIAPVEGNTASTNHAVNSYLIQANQLYRVTSAIATGEAITPGTNCIACTVMGELIRLTA